MVNKKRVDLSHFTLDRFLKENSNFFHGTYKTTNVAQKRRSSVDVGSVIVLIILRAKIFNRSDRDPGVRLSRFPEK